MTGGPTQLNEAFVRGLPDAGPVVMVNLVRFRPSAAAGGGSGEDAYLRYSRSVTPLLKARAATVLWAGRAEGAAFGDPKAGRWDYIVLVRYPSRAAFLDMVTSPEYAKANTEREAGVEDHLIIASAETYSKLASP